MLRTASFLLALSLLLAAPAAFASDVNGDGTVDAADVELARGAVNTTAGDADYIAEADVDGDGVVSLADLNAIINAAQ